MIPVVILCGGQGLRMKDKFPDTPKSLIPINGVTILNRIMQIYSIQGFRHFILLLGHQDKQIIQNFTKDESKTEYYQQYDFLDFAYTDDFIGECRIQFINTLEHSTTSKRILLAKEFLSDYENFFLTYADGLSDINLADLLKLHYDKKPVVTITGVQPTLSYGVLNICEELVTSFNEKPKAPFWINGGFMVISDAIFNFLDEQNNLEYNTFNKLVAYQKLAVFKHYGFWKCMDTEKDYVALEELLKIPEHGLS